MGFPGTTLAKYDFMGGLNSQLAEFQLDSPYLQNANNITFNQIGQIDKRTGFTKLSNNIMGGGNISSGKEITVYNGELIQFDGEYLYSWQPEEEVWINKGTCFSTQCEQIRVLNTKASTQSNPDATTSNNITVYAWEDNRVNPANAQGIRYSVVNNVTNSIVVSDQLIYPHGALPKVVSDGNIFYILYCASDNVILYDTIPVNRPNLITSQYNVLTTNGYSINLLSNIAYDVCIDPIDNGVWITYADKRGYIFATTLTRSLLFQLSATHASCIGSCYDSSGILWVCWSDTDTNQTYVNAYRGGDQLFVSDIPIGSHPSCNISIIEGADKGSVNITVETFAGGTGFYNYINNYVVSSGGVATAKGTVRGIGLASKPFLQDGNIFLNCIKSTALQSTYLTLCMTHNNFPCVAKHSPQNGGNLRTNSIMAQCDPMGENEFLFAGQRKGAFTSYNNAQTVNLGAAGYTINFDVDNSFGNTTSSNNLHIVGGVKKIYDGISCVEDNFHFYPETESGFGCDLELPYGPTPPCPYQGGTGQISAGLYQYIVVYEWTDNYGQVQRSGASVANSIQNPTVGSYIIVTVPTLNVTDKINPRTPVVISIYRTQANLPIFYKITDDTNPIINNQSVDSIQYCDSASDISIGANENLYTGSQLSNIAPPSCSLISQYQTRVMINQDEDKDVIWYSQNKFEQDQYNTLPLDWNTSFVQGVDAKLGSTKGITAIGLLDSSLAIFKETSVFLLQGDGPNALDTSGNFNDAFLLVADTGCSEPKSLVFVTQTAKTPGGLLFKSNKGIYLLGRDQSLYPIGKPVQQYNNLHITGANLLTRTNEIAFTTEEGTVLVYNYLYDAWYTWSSLPSVASTMWNDKLVILHPNGTVMIQDDTGTVWSDDNNIALVNVTMSLKTPWIKIQSPHIQGRFLTYCMMLLGTYQAPHTLQIGVSFDYNPSIMETVLINSNTTTNRFMSLSPFGFSTGTFGSFDFANYQYQINLKNPRGYYGGGMEAIQFTITEIDPVESQGFSLNSIELEVAPIPGQYNVSTNRKVGSK